MSEIKKEVIKKLAASITRWSEAYYNGSALVEDTVFDEAVEKLKKMDPDNPALKKVGAKPAVGNTLKKTKHSILMGSLNKAINKEEFLAWALGCGEGEWFFANQKMDGCSISLKYKDGKLVQCLTRGDGIEGEDITANARHFLQLPKEPVHNGDFTAEVRAEAVLHKDAWLELDPEQLTNPRNIGSGICRRKDGTDSNKLRVYALRLHTTNGYPVGKDEEGNTMELERAGFTCAPYMLLTGGDWKEVWEFYQKTAVDRPNLPYWIDGIVVSVDDYEEQFKLGINDQRPKGQIAIKFPTVGVNTVLRDVVLSVGHTGAIVPTGKFDPVQLGGATVQSALLCNWSIIKELGIAIGDTVVMEKAGDIIPRVREVVERPKARRIIEQPKVCPVCGGFVGHKTIGSGASSEALFCLADNCSAKLVGKLKRYITSLNILGIGDEILEAMVKHLKVKEPADLYDLTAAALAPLIIGEGKVRLGEKRAEGIVAEIAKRKTLTIEEFLGSLGIDGLGKRRVALVREAAPPNVLDDVKGWLSGDLVKHAETVGLPGSAKKIQDDLLKNREMINNLCKQVMVMSAPRKGGGAAPAPVVVQGNRRNVVPLSFCLTGKMERPRAEWATIIQNAGHYYHDSMCRGLNYLVMADPDSNSSKAAKARQMGVNCINEQRLQEILNRQ